MAEENVKYEKMKDIDQNYYDDVVLWDRFVHGSTVTAFQN